MNEFDKLKQQVTDIVFNALSDINCVDRLKVEIVDSIMAATGMTKYSPDYHSLYVDMWMARIDGVNLEDYP